MGVTETHLKRRDIRSLIVLRVMSDNWVHMFETATVKKKRYAYQGKNSLGIMVRNAKTLRVTGT